MIAWRRRRTSPSLALIWALAIACAILWAVYPGFMSYDSLHALREARTQVQGGPYPPFPSYLWRLVEMVYPGPAPMLLLQNAALLGAFAAFFVISGVGPWLALPGLVAVALAPALLGPMLVVWKDVAMSAAFALACSILLLLHADRPRGRGPLFAAALVLIFCGMALRLNAAPAGLPLLVWAAAIGWRPAGATPRRRWIFLPAGIALTLLFAAGVTVLNMYRLPDFSRLSPNVSPRSLQIFDLVGTTAMAGLLPFAPPAGQDASALAREAREIYDPRHINLTLEARPDGFYRALAADPLAAEAEVGRNWRIAVAAEPLAYLQHRWAVFRELTGIVPRAVFYPTDAGVVANEYGYEHRAHWGSEQLVGYVLGACGPSPVASLGCRVWAYLCVGLAATLICLWVGAPALRVAAVAVYSSGLFYLLPQFVISPAGDLRYAHWSVAASILCGVLALGALRARQGRVP